MKESITASLMDIYRRLLAEYGPQHWWPATTPFEVIIGAILTQATAWTNVEKAIRNLKTAGALTPSAIRRLPGDELAGLIRPCGYYNDKSVKLKAFASWLDGNYGDSLERLFALDIISLREQLLTVYGIGDETADSIVLYAAGKPVFVIDNYTKRIFSRMGYMPRAAGYPDYQGFFMRNLPDDAQLYNEYHALLVQLGKNTCRKRPLCDGCCLGERCRARE
jgi:endonuclease-3 related protein